MTRLSGARLAVIGALIAACADVQRPQYGVQSFTLKGTDAMAAQAIENCLLTHARERVTLTLGLASTACNEPPFDKSPPTLRLWHWPWTSWPSFNPAVLDQDVRRIERWYRARGFYDAAVVAVTVLPEHALDPGGALPEGACQPEREDCTVEVVIAVREGEPLRVGTVNLEGLEGLPEPLRTRVSGHDALPRPGVRFDEHDHERTKQALAGLLTEASYAAARVFGEIRLDRAHGKAHLRYRVEPGASYRLGEVRVEGNKMVPLDPIVAAAGVHAGEPYRESLLREIQHEIHALGAFAAVEVERVLDQERGLAHFLVRVTPQPVHAYRLGVGIMSGALQRTETGELASVPQWDVHLSGMVERRHALFGLGKLRIEDRPRLIFNEAFPRFPDPKLGNLLRISLNQMGLIEPRTDLFTSAQWDYGPDPFLGFFRHDIIGRLGVKRAFLRRRLFVTFALQQDTYLVEPGAETSDDSPLPKSYLYDFLEQDVRYDLRDSPLFPRKGAYFGLYASESVRWAGSDWSSVRLSPEVRGYAPLPLQMVFAARAAVTALFITSANPALDAASQQLGPNAYRLRGGGASSNRGFLAGQLGAGLEGGVRRWEFSCELRARLGEWMALVAFLDFGDVHAEPRLRFDHLNGSAGWGLRFITPVGSIRFDVGYRVAALRGAAGAGSPNRLWLTDTPGAYHLTIGEAF